MFIIIIIIIIIWCVYIVDEEVNMTEMAFILESLERELKNHGASDSCNKERVICERFAADADKSDKIRAYIEEA